MKTCPKCKNLYSDDDNYCSMDGISLIPFKGHKNKRLTIVTIVFVVLCILLLFIANLSSHLIKWAASNCEVSLSGVSMPRTESGKSAIEDTIDSIKELFSSKKQQDQKNSNSEKQKPESEDIVLILNVRNNNPVPVNVLLVDVELSINDNNFGTGQIKGEDIYLNAWENKVVRMPLSISLITMFTSTGNMIISEKLVYRATGHIKVNVIFGSVLFPFDVKGVNLPVL